MWCHNNRLINLNVSGCTALDHLQCYNNQLTELDLSNNTKLQSLYCYSNQLTELDLSNNTKLQSLYCYNNQLTALDISNNTKLQSLHCYDNKLTALDVSNNTALYSLHCYNNQLTTLDISNCPYLLQNENNSYYFKCDDGVTIIREKTKPTITTEALPIAVKGEIYSLQFMATGSMPISWTFSGSLPEGMSFNEAGVISGTPTDAGSFPLTITASNSVGSSSALFTLSVEEHIAPTITTNNLENAALEKSYSVTLNASGNTPITWTAVGLPNGLTISETTGEISGTPTKYGTFTVSFTAANPYGKVTKNIKLTVTAPANITTTSLQNATINNSYSVTLNALGTTPITWSAAGLPTGLTIDSSSGKISGTPTEYGTFTGTFTASNAYGSSTKILKLTIVAPPTITTASLKNATLKKSYSVALKASGTTPITWTATGLPAGLTIDSNNGKISGKPTGSGSFDVNFTAENSYGTSTKTLSLFVGVAPSITTKALKNAALKKSYSVTLKASGTTPVTWTATGLPKGLSIAKGSNVISGTPTKSGSFDVKITAKNSHGSNTKTLSLFVGIAPSIATSSLKNATLNKSYSVTLKASGTTPITWTATGLPKGLSIAKGSNVISGTPTKSGSFDVKITAKNSHGSNTKTLSLFVGIAPSIATSSLKNATLNKSYSVTLKASGTTPVMWSAKGLPAGLTIDSSTGKISGTPTKSGSSSVKITAKNSHGSSTKTLSLFVGVAPSITTKTLKNATLKKAYSVTLKASGTAPITWSATGLPEGLTIDSSTGKISGTPTKSGSSSVKITAKNSHGSNTKTLKLFVGIPASITTKSITYGLAGKSYSVALKANGTAAITWSIKSGNLPEGLTLAENGKISGKPTKSGTSTFTVIAKNAYGSSTKKLTLKVYALPNITTSTLKSGTVGKSYSATLKATGSGTITWSATGLPSGLSINKSNGKISGKPKVSGVFTVSVKAASTYGSKTKKFSLTISDASSTAENYTEDYSSTTTLQTLSGTARVQAAPSATTQTESYFIAYVFDNVISVDKAGLYDFDVELDEETPEGWTLVWIANSDKPSDDDEIADFFDCEGAPIEVVPHDKKISVSVWFNPNCVYEPAIAAIKQQ